MRSSTSRARRALTATAVVAVTALVLFSNMAFKPAASRVASHPQAAAGIYIDPIPSTTLWVSNMDPALISLLNDAEVAHDIYAGLVKQVYSDKTHRFTVQPDLASGWKVSNHGLVYTFKIRSDAKFSDGTPVTAQDFVYSLTRALNPKANNGAPSAVAYYLFDIAGAQDYNSGKAKSVKGLKALNSSTLQITLYHPVVYFLLALSYNTGFVLKQNVPINAPLTTNPSLVVGAGPWMLKNHTWQYRHEIDLVPNPYYPGSKTFKLKEIHIVFTGTDATQFAGYQSGEFPITKIPSTQVAQFKNRPDFHQTTVLGDTWLTMNEHYKPFNNLHFRLAVAYAIDRNAIANGVLHQTVTPQYSWYPKGILGYVPNIQKMSGVPTYNLTKAKQELALAKKQLGTIPSFQIEVNTEDPDRVAAMNFIAAQLHSTLGLDVSTHLVSGHQWSEDGNGGKVPCMFADWYDDYPDPQDFSDYLIKTGAGENWGRYSNPTVDKLFEQGAVETDQATRAHLYEQAQLIILRQAPVVMLWQFAEQDLISPKYHGIEMNPSWGVFPQPVGNNWANVSVSS